MANTRRPTPHLPTGFTPSATQLAFREHARVQWEAGRRLVPQWVARFEDLTVADVKRWLDIEAFTDWWKEAFPEHAGLTSLDAKAIDYTANEAMMALLLSSASEDKSRGLAVWQRMRAAEAAAGELNPGDEEDLQAYLKGAPETRWLAGPAGEAK